MGSYDPALNRNRVARHRAAMRAQGLRPRTIWVPDVKDPGFVAEFRRQGALLDRSDDEREVIAIMGAAWDESMVGEPDYDWGEAGPP